MCDLCDYASSPDAVCGFCDRQYGTCSRCGGGFCDCGEPMTGYFAEGQTHCFWCASDVGPGEGLTSSLVLEASQP